MATRRSTFRALAGLTALALVAACGGGNGEGDSSGSGGQGAATATIVEAGDPPPAPDPADVVDPRDEGITLTEDTVVVPGGPDVVVAASTDGRTFTLDSGREGVSDLTEGSVLLVTGMLAGRVEALEPADDGVAVTLGPVALTDLVHDGQLAFESTELDPAEAIVRTWEEPVDPETYVVDPGEGGASTPTPTGESQSPADTAAVVPIGVAAQGPPVSSSGTTEVTYGDYRIKITSTDADSGATTRRFDVTATRSGVDLTLSAILTQNRFRADGAFDVVGGVVQGGHFEVGSLSGSAELRATARYADGEGAVDDLLKVPWEESYPIILSGIPFYVSLRASLSVTPSFTTSSAQIGASTKITFDGNGGWRLQDSLLSPIGELTLQETERPMDTFSVTSFGAAGFVVAAQLPRIGFGIGYGPISAGVFLDLVTSMGLTTTGASAMAQCQRTDRTMVARAGIEEKFGLLGFGFNTESAARIELGSDTATVTEPPTAACPLA